MQTKGDFRDGHSFKIQMYSDDNENSKEIVDRLEVYMIGTNASGELIMNSLKIRYTNECGIPTFQVGDFLN